MKKHRIMVIGSNVTTVQRVSSYCLKQSSEVLPYYGIPSNEEITLFAPEVLVLCLPIANDFCYQIHPYILWSEQFIDKELPSATTPTELYARLQEALQT